jgi:hypothetical protein
MLRGSSAAGTLIGSTAGQSSSWATAGVCTEALSGGPYTVTGSFWAVTLANNNTASTDNPNFVAAASARNISTSVRVITSTARFGRILTGQTALQCQLVRYLAANGL